MQNNQLELDPLEVLNEVHSISEHIHALAIERVRTRMLMKIIQDMNAPTLESVPSEEVSDGKAS